MRLLFALVCTVLLWPGVSVGASAMPALKLINGRECVVLLHGLLSTYHAMWRFEERLNTLGYETANIDYPSARHTVDELTSEVMAKGIGVCQGQYPERIHFITHSMGGILVRYYLAQHDIDRLGRVVMLSPPNQGSEMVNRLEDWPVVGWVLGPAGLAMGTNPDSVPQQLGPVDFELGIIAGNRSINLVFSLLIPGDDDGTVSVARTQVEGMDDFIVMPYTHPFIMRQPAVVDQAVYFLQQGRFYRSAGRGGRPSSREAGKVREKVLP